MFETIDGKLHEFVEGAPPRPLSDAEAVSVIWGCDCSSSAEERGIIGDVQWGADGHGEYWHANLYGNKNGEFQVIGRTGSFYICENCADGNRMRPSRAEQERELKDCYTLVEDITVQAVENAGCQGNCHFPPERECRCQE